MMQAAKENILIVEDEFIVALDLQTILRKSGYKVAGIAASVNEALDILNRNEVDLVMLDIYLKGRQTGIDLAHHLLKRHIPFIYISANSNEKVLSAAKATHPYGFIVKPYRENDVLLSVDIARYRYQHDFNLRESVKVLMQGYIEELGSFKLEPKLLKLISGFQPYVPFDIVVVTLFDKERNITYETYINRSRFNKYRILSVNDIYISSGPDNKTNRVYNSMLSGADKAIYGSDSFHTLTETAPAIQALTNRYALKSALVNSILLSDSRMLTFTFLSSIADIYEQGQLDLLGHLNDTLAVNVIIILDAILAENKGEHPEVSESEIDFIADPDINFEGLTGESADFLKMLDQIKIVAPTDTSVLIMGESGTGKELVAINLHRLSRRSSKPMITINCAALPGELIESILFGHEKGAFTGANEKRIGKFEEADGGTIFLDEIGEMPVDLQSKLLRVLQEKEIESIGANSSKPVNLRIIAATSRNLEKEIAAGTFRLDLYYRLNVFPILVPSLKDRRDDIPALVKYFIEKYARLLGKNVAGISDELVNTLANYDWPGNIRELENYIERSVLLSAGEILTVNLLEPQPGKTEMQLTDNVTVKTIAENERDHIIAVLKLCKGKISGDSGAAALLGIPATTLNSKIKKLGIKR